MLVLVTGGTGFIGSHLVDELIDKGYNVRVLKRPTSTDIFLKGKKLTFSIGDLKDPKSLEIACSKVDIVFHVAAIPRDWGPKKTFFEVNLEGTKNLLDACVINKVPKFVYMSSAAVYGFPKTNKPITEDYPRKPNAKYGMTKFLAEKMLWEYGEEKNMFVSALRSPLVTGPRDNMIAPFFVKAVQCGRFFYIGDGKQQISISDGRDVAHCLRLIAETEKANGQAYNIKSFDSTPKQLITALSEDLGIPVLDKHRSFVQAYTIAFFIELLWTILNKKDPPLTKHKVKVLGTTRILDITKAENELNYKPRYTYKSTIEDIKKYMKSNK